jgi:UDP-N-acetylglucosamine 2-epimerase (non-hydrolysing)
MLRILSVIGTRPEAIKMAPVIREFGKKAEQVESIVCVTAQQREMLDQVVRLFDLRPDIDLDLMKENQDLAGLTARSVTAISEVLERTQPDVVLVQGDTTTAMVSALAAFYRRIPVGHVEAGLRTGSRYSPFPEEIDRRLVGVLATYHFAPTETAAEALRSEGVPHDHVFVTGNTVIDALFWAISRPRTLEVGHLLRTCGARLPSDQTGAASTDGQRIILVTAHRRENFGRPLENICSALRAIVRRNADVEIVYAVHRNPNVREPVHRMLGGQERVHLVEPLDYEPFTFLMKQAYLILTDSGGIQEEAPALGKPVLVLRTETERPEAVKAGTVKVVGVECDRIVGETERFLRDRRTYDQVARAVNPYGDGHAAERIVKTILEIYHRSEQKVLA